MRTKHVVQAIIFVALLGSLGFNYMLWKTKENIQLVNDKIIDDYVARNKGMQGDLDRKGDYIRELEGRLGVFYGTSSFGSERDNQKIIHEELGGQMEVVLDCGSRVDLVFELEGERTFGMVACEIDWAYKWAEGIGQSIYYWLKLNYPIMRRTKEQGVPLNPRTLHRPMVILLAKGKDSGWEKYRDKVEFVGKFLPRPGLACWVFDAETKTWLDKE